MFSLQYLQSPLGPSKRKRVSEVRDLMLQQRLQSLLDLRKLLFLLDRDAAHPVRPARQRRGTVNDFHRGAYSSRAQAGVRAGCEVSSIRNNFYVLTSFLIKTLSVVCAS